MKKKSKDFKFDFLVLIAFFTAIIFIYATYAWFSSTLNVDLNLVKIKVNTEDDFSFSLDGENWTNQLTISKKTILDDLESIYPTNKNRWASEGLTTLSSPGLQYKNDYFTFYSVVSVRRKKVNDRSVIVYNAGLEDEDERSEKSDFIAFDLFFKNVSHKPIDDNIYITDSTKVLDASGDDNVSQNAVRIGMAMSDKIPSSTNNRDTIQNLKCQNNCKSAIYEPNSTIHLEKSINKAQKNGIIIENGKKYPTYALLKDGNKINMYEGLYNSGFNINPTYFKDQNTISDGNTPFMQLKSQIIKVRMYIWIEGQDLDLIAMNSTGYKLDINIDFKKNK